MVRDSIPLTSDGSPSARRASSRRRHLPGGNLLRIGILLYLFILLTRVFVVETYQVPTASMAPKLVGHHRACDCPRCGHPVKVGLHPLDHGEDSPNPKWYRRAFCPNCRFMPVPVHEAPVTKGQRMLVSKPTFAYRMPARWEIVLFRLLGIDLIKRMIGLPGETIEIKNGDIYVDGELCRKTLDEIKAMRILVFDNNYQPQPMTWAARWDTAPVLKGPPALVGTELHLDASREPEAWQLVSYTHFSLDANKFQPISDEYSYNGADPRPLVPVHDLMLTCDLEVLGELGNVVLGITDGLDHVLVELPIAADSAQPATVFKADAFSLIALNDPKRPPPLASKQVSLQPGKRYHIELALVDRRWTLAIDGQQPFGFINLPACGQRPAIVRPVMLAGKGAKLVVANVRLDRDVHYTQAGKNGVGGAVVRLGPDQYFVLGDNSPRSEDSRFWAKGGAVPMANLIGTPAWYGRQ